ncbi:dTMP kinase [Dethiobacter alkaliphilus]|uniref:dTMP kinase n=1 Tax=Dethiobacter alkaliphilus TaxID=427926 RepID=UPI0022263F61|nr:dTMP kinase [Dethiobacter alkaliphilus]MCW3489091.1 dTMP kinase [Dethiobacter alkaliphilus]
MKKGFFITLEGPDGAGKTTQLTRLSDAARQMGIQVVCTREPGGTPVGDAVRRILLDTAYSEMVPLTEVFLYAAARAQLFHQVIGPALKQGQLVLCDRFIDSTLAYQSYGGEMDFSFVLETNLQAVRHRLPDLTFVLDIDPSVGVERRGAGTADRVEQKSLSFHHRVRDGFLSLADKFPERIKVVKGTQSEDEVFAVIWNQVAPLLEKLR